MKLTNSISSAIFPVIINKIVRDPCKAICHIKNVVNKMKRYINGRQKPQILHLFAIRFIYI